MRADHSVSGIMPDAVPPSEHEVVVNVTTVPDVQPARKPLNVDRWPTIDLGPWPEGLSLRREDIYGDDGR